LINKKRSAIHGNCPEIRTGGELKTEMPLKMNNTKGKKANINTLFVLKTRVIMKII
jgi:hypothetical protein